MKMLGSSPTPITSFEILESIYLAISPHTMTHAYVDVFCIFTALYVLTVLYCIAKASKNGGCRDVSVDQGKKLM